MPTHIFQHPESLSVVRLGPLEEPEWDWRAGPFSSLSASTDETSVVCLAEPVPEGRQVEGPFCAFEVAGPLDFSTVGLLHGLLEPLVAKEISVLAMSTFDTDWLLVPTPKADLAAESLRRSGCFVTPPTLRAP